MRHYIVNVARSTLKLLSLIQPVPSRFHNLYAVRAFSIFSPRAQNLLQATFSGRQGTSSARRKQLGLRMSSLDHSPETEKQKGFFQFGQYKIGLEEVFLTTKLSFCFVNLRPVVPGHVLVCPKRVVPRFAQMTAEEVTDLWLTAQRVGEKLESFFGGSSLTLSIQDGPEAGQTVPHVHVHVLPRRKEDFKNNDEIYDELDKKEKEMGEKLNLDQERKDRTPEVMHEEASELRALF